MKPALTAEEWGEVSVHEPDVGRYEIASGRMLVWVDGGYHYVRRRDALAALALHGQSSGFTHEDVKLVRELIDAVQEYSGGHYHLEETMADDLADRIAALLPPRDVRNEDLPPIFRAIAEGGPTEIVVEEPYGLSIMEDLIPREDT